MARRQSHPHPHRSNAPAQGSKRTLEAEKQPEAARRSASGIRAAPPPRQRAGGHAEAAEREAAIHAVVRAIPRGRVATYGQIAELAGLRAGHRIVARAMRSCPGGLPWQRVVGKKDARRAQIAIQEPEHGARQRALLEKEGVRFDASGFIVLRTYGWLPP